MRRGFVIVGVCAAMAGVSGAAAGLHDHGSLARTQLERDAVRANAALKDFAVIRTPGGANPTLQLRSAATGAIVRGLGQLGAQYTNNGFAFSPDGRLVFATLIGRGTLRIERISVSTGDRSILANGEQPAISSDGAHLAYASGAVASPVVAVRALASGAQRQIDLSRLLGASYELLNSSISWTRDGASVVVLASHVAMAVARDTKSPKTPPGATPDSCSSHPTSLCLITIAVPRSGAPLSARRVVLSAPSDGVLSLTADGSTPRAVMLLSAIKFDTVLSRVQLTGATAHVTRVALVHRALVVALNPAADRILYLRGSRQPALWRGDISSGRLIHQHRLIPDVWLQAASW